MNNNNDVTARLNRGISHQYSAVSLRKSSGRYSSFRRQDSPRRINSRFSFGRQSSLDPLRRSPGRVTSIARGVSRGGSGFGSGFGGFGSGDVNGIIDVPDDLDSTIQFLFMACKGDVNGVGEALDCGGIDVNSVDFDGRTALHIAACEGHVEVVELLLSKGAHIDGPDRWGSTAAADAKYYGNVEVYNILISRGAKVPKTSGTPMTVSNPREVPEYELNPLDVQIQKDDGISKGSYQDALLNGTKVSVKILDMDSHSDPQTIDAFKDELTLLEKVRHPNVVQFVGAVTQVVPMMIVVEYHSQGDLGTYIQKKGRLSISKALKFALDIARGMNYLHECKPDPIIHCDLKPKNILLDCGGQLKVAGFGLVRMSKISHGRARLEQAEAVDCSSLYVAPEVFKDEEFDRSVDVYSFGLMLYEMMEGVPPFHSKSPEVAAKLMCLEGQRPPFKTKSKVPPEVKELIDECWDPEAVVRPTFNEIIVRLDRVVVNYSKLGWLKETWKETFKFPWR